MNRWLILAAAVLIGGSAAWLAGRSGADAARRERDGLETRLAEAQATIDRLAAELARAKEAKPPSAAPSAPAQISMPPQQDAVPEPLMVTTVRAGNAEGPPPLTEAAVSAIERFDLAMDREFDRLDEREARAADEAESVIIRDLKGGLEHLDELYRRADLASDDEERIAIRREMQQAMGTIIGLARRDRDEQLARLAADIGYTDPDAVAQFIREIDRVYRETHMDWTKLFNRTPPAMAPAGGRSVSPGMAEEASPRPAP